MPVCIDDEDRVRFAKILIRIPEERIVDIKVFNSEEKMKKGSVVCWTWLYVILYAYRPSFLPSI